MTERSPEIMHERLATESFKAGCLEELARQLQRGSYPGYPAFSQRLWIDGNLQFLDNEPLMLPFGPWDTSGGALPTLPEQEALRDRCRLDFHGRPLHPWLDAMLHNARIGVLTGKGFFWKWGPNYTADSIVIRHDLAEPHVLLIKRQDTGALALPGGFLDANEDALDGAFRETLEETGLDLSPYDPVIQQVYNGPLSDLRMTANAWPETTAYRFDITDAPAKIQAGDDAADALWLPLSELDGCMFGAHGLLIRRALTGPAVTPG